MKQWFKKIFKLFLIFVVCSLLITEVNAESVSSKLTMTYSTMSSTPMSFPANFHVKKTSSGKYAYCTYYSKKPPVSSITYSKGSKVTDNGLNYILNKSYSASNNNNFFIYQNALWIYMIDKGMMKGAYYDLTVFKSRVNSSSSSTATKIKNLVSNAKKASANDTSAPTITVSTSGAKFTLTNGNYVSSGITVTSSTGKFTVALSSAPEGSTATISNNQVIITVPASKVTSLNTTISFTVSNSKNVYTSYYYNPSNSAYQIMAVTYKNTKSSNASGSLSIQKTASIDVSKVDESGVALSGAGLQVINSSGAVIDSWTSDGNKHTVSGLTADTYTIKEISAPSGYKLSSTEIKFVVNSDGTIKDSSGNAASSFTVKNEKTAVTISKQDITSKTELPGATLVIKNSSGKEVVSWTSSSKQYVIKGLAAGTYTLSETIAPEGYALSTETITFTIDKYGKLTDGNGASVEKITMYNTPVKEDTRTIISKRDIETNTELKGATLKITKENGETYETFTTDGTSHVIVNMTPGKYTLSEVSAPEGYVLTTETITFTVDSNGKLLDKDGKSIERIILYNQKKTTTGGVSISKQDITNGSELPGATLVVKDYDGNIIDTWVSTDTPHLIENLNAGIYTLNETIAPEGYILSSETITFTVKDDGSVTKVVMYNSPNGKEVPVESTGSYKTIASSLVGGVIVVIGFVLMLVTGKKKNLD